MASVHKKLMAARICLHGMKIIKSGRNDFAKYNYMELGDFLIPTQTIFAELGLCGVVSFSKDIATLTITDVEDGSELVLTSPMGSAALKGCHEVQNVGAVETYQRRYLWVSAMEIVEHDAIDSSPPIEKKTTRAPVIPATPVIVIDQETETYLQDMAMELIGFVKAGTPHMAHEKIEAEALEDDQKIALWKMLDSSTRSAIKSAKQQLKEIA